MHPSTTRNVDREFTRFTVDRSTALLRVAHRLAKDPGHAEDLLQTALMKTYVAWRRINDPGAVEAYARRVLANTATSWWRQRARHELPIAVVPEQPAPTRIDGYADRDLLWQAVRALPARQRAVLLLRYYADHSESETARRLGVSVGTVKSQTSRALATLRVRLAGA